MSVTELSRDRVEGRLASLEETYSSFPINQTTLSVSTGVYERAHERCEAGLVDVYVTVYNDAEDVLLLENEDAWELPHAESATGERLEERARTEVRNATGVRCSITGVRRVTILGLLDETEADCDPVYQLVAVLSARHVEGSPGEAVEWRSTLPDSARPI